MIGILNFFQNLLDKTRALDFPVPLALRLYLDSAQVAPLTRQANRACCNTLA